MPPLDRQDLPDYTWDDHALWEGEWELIEGVPFAMTPSPLKNHQRLAGLLFSRVNGALASCPDCEVLIDVDWKVEEHTVLRPDVVVVCGDDDPRHVTRTPELVFEIASPPTRRRDEGVKRRRYEREGVRHYVILFAEERRALALRHDGERFVEMPDASLAPLDFDRLSCPFTLDLGALFGALRF